MDIRPEQRRERIVHESVPLYQRQAGKRFGHDAQPEVPSGGRAGMSGMPGTLIEKVQLGRLQALLQQPPDITHALGGRCHVQACVGAGRRAASHSPWPAANSIVAAVMP
jgi:hypothetical protein